MPELDAVIFDLDGVLCELSDARRFARLQEISGRSPAFAQESVWKSGFEDAADRGDLTAEEYLLGFGERIEYPLTRAEFADFRGAGMIPYPDVLCIAKRVATQSSVALLTNNGLLLKEVLPTIFPELEQIFGDRLFVSAEFRTRKPDPAIYLAVCERLNVAPVRTLMIDDRPDNIEGARRAGLQGHLYQDSHSLRTDLISRGLLPE